MLNGLVFDFLRGYKTRATGAGFLLSHFERQMVYFGLLTLVKRDLNQLGFKNALVLVAFGLINFSCMNWAARAVEKLPEVTALDKSYEYSEQ